MDVHDFLMSCFSIKCCITIFFEEQTRSARYYCENCFAVWDFKTFMGVKAFWRLSTDRRIGEARRWKKYLRRQQSDPIQHLMGK